MKNKPGNTIIAACLLWMALPVHLACQAGKNSKMMESVQKLDARIDFYGRVIDDTGQPIEGAAVLLHIHQFSALNPAGLWSVIVEHPLKTDKNGNFKIQGEKGSEIYINRIQKRHYDESLFRFGNYKINFNYGDRHDATRPIHIPDPSNPVVYRLRKKGPEAFLMKGGGGFTFTLDESGVYKGYDFFREGSAFSMKPEELENPKDFGDPVTCDLRAQATFDARRGLWTLVLAPGNADGGILASRDLLYEAPAMGYQPSLTIQAPAMLDRDPRSGDLIRTPVPARYLYLRSRKDPTHSIYSRIDLGEEIRVSWTPPRKKGDAPVASIHLGASATVNPYGERILEEATDLPGDVSFELRKEVRAAYRRGERPEAPNLAQRVKLWEQSRPLVDKVKDWFKP